jgi:hypothetical protein
MDSTSGRVKKNESFCTYEVSDSVLNERRCGGGVDGTEAVNLMEDFLQSIDAGDYVFVRTRHLGRSGPADISDRVETLLRTLGGTGTTHSDAMVNDSLSYEDLWLLLAQKGSPSRTVEQVALASEDGNEIVERPTLSFNYPRGRTVTNRIGPVSAWDSLRWKTREPSGTIQIDVLAADTNQVLIQSDGRTGNVALDAIDPSQHPYLRLRATLTDSSSRTAPQLKQWNATYDGVPELAIDPSGLHSIPDTVQKQGEPLALSLPISNLGTVASGSLRVQYDITDASNVTTTRAVDTLAALSPGARDTSAARLSSANLPGSNVLTVTVRASGPPERISNNNTVVRNFVVRRDRTPRRFGYTPTDGTSPPPPTQSTTSSPRIFPSSRPIPPSKSVFATTTPTSP